VGLVQQAAIHCENRKLLLMIKSHFFAPCLEAIQNQVHMNERRVRKTERRIADSSAVLGCGKPRMRAIPHKAIMSVETPRNSRQPFACIWKHPPARQTIPRDIFSADQLRQLPQKFGTDNFVSVEQEKPVSAGLLSQ